MKIPCGIFLFLMGIFPIILAKDFKVLCYYDTFSINRKGTGNFTNQDLRRAMPLCNAIIYGYIGIDSKNFRVTTLHPLQQRQFLKVEDLKLQYPQVKFLVSLGGDKDLDSEKKYLKLLKAKDVKQNTFIKSVRNFLLQYQFDGLDLAYQFPKNISYQSNSGVRDKIKFYKKKMTQLIKNLSGELIKYKKMLSLTVLPNVQSKAFYNITGIIGHLNFVTLAAFDFSSPKRTPHQAYYLAPIKAPSKKENLKLNQINVNSVLNEWIGNKVIPPHKLVLGITVNGRTWNITKRLKDPKMPILQHLNGPAPGGHMTRKPGLLAWPEICRKLGKITQISIPQYGNYAYRPGFKKTDEGMLIIYENRKSIAEKVKFAKDKNLGGIGFFDLSTDDYRGRCWGQRYDLLKVVNTEKGNK